ncbi:ycf55-like protein, partial [Tanacetum coccineum]
ESLWTDFLSDQVDSSSRVAHDWVRFPSDSFKPLGFILEGFNDFVTSLGILPHLLTLMECVYLEDAVIDKGTGTEGEAYKRMEVLAALRNTVDHIHSMRWTQKAKIKLVDNISRSTSTADLKDLQKVFSEILQRSSLSICTDWLKDELSLRNRKSKTVFLRLFDQEFPPPLFEKLKGDDSVLQNVKKSGKEDLYTELVYILRFGSLSQECCYDSDFFASRGVSVLEDLVITLADGIASIYLELISVDSDMSNEMNNLGLNLCALSTRALQRLRNEVSLNQWFVQNMETVASMYEDRFDLRILQSRPIPESTIGKTEKFGWLKKLNLGKSSASVSSLRAAVISHVCVPVKRTKELRGLVGWRYYFSLYLEMADITMPFVRTLVAKISDAVSFFLVCLIGRSLGLIYTGVLPSLQGLEEETGNKGLLVEAVVLVHSCFLE